MNYLSYKYIEGDGKLKEVVECLQFQTDIGVFQIELCRTPDVVRVKTTSPITFEAEDYSHYVYASFSKRSAYLWVPPCRFPDSEEGFEQAKKRFNSLLAEFYKMKNQASPKRWSMFKKNS